MMRWQQHGNSIDTMVTAWQQHGNSMVLAWHPFSSCSPHALLLSSCPPLVFPVLALPRSLLDLPSTCSSCSPLSPLLSCSLLAPLLSYCSPALLLSLFKLRSSRRLSLAVAAPGPQEEEGGGTEDEADGGGGRRRISGIRVPIAMEVRTLGTELLSEAWIPSS